MTLLHQAAQKAVEELRQVDRAIPAFAVATRSRLEGVIEALESALQHQEEPREPVATLRVTLEYDDEDGPLEIVCHGTELNMRRLDARLKFLHRLEKQSNDCAASPSTTRQQEVGSGWKLVPVEPTPEMIAAYLRANVAYWKRTDELPPPPNKWRTGTPSDATAESYRAMLAAAPSTPEKAGGVTAGGEELRPKFRGKCPDDSHCSFSCLKDEPCLRSNAAAREVAKRIAGVSASVSHPLPAQANDGGEHG